MLLVLAAGGEDGTVRIWDLRAPGGSAQRTYESRAAVNTVVLHPNQGELISGQTNTPAVGQANVVITNDCNHCNAAAHTMEHDGYKRCSPSMHEVLVPTDVVHVV